jgi:hypothetical protein
LSGPGQDAEVGRLKVPGISVSGPDYPNKLVVDPAVSRRSGTSHRLRIARYAQNAAHQGRRYLKSGSPQQEVSFNANPAPALAGTQESECQ